MSNDFGGRMTLRFSNSTLISLRSTVTMSPGRNSVEAIANQDGSVDRAGTVKPGTCEISFAAADDHDYDALISGNRFNATLIEEFGGRTHYFTNAFLSGEASINRMNGEVTGLSLTFEGYRKAAS
ncbi:phage tail tube protein [Agrobacterium sp. CNPSo 3708]|uniref:phage tail tube protein n=1 Tax=Agrobacterium sp. CNPSo 3708 TaxID=3028150 RepID=UPI002363972E|nr:phage tail tube protein [Agrobacterium sp. CNPSo 3708]MDD1499806.1 phage tail tube protein [Agrobacterium sp. CNPSo 3708]